MLPSLLTGESARPARRPSCRPEAREAPRSHVRRASLPFPACGPRGRASRGWRSTDRRPAAAASRRMRITSSSMSWAVCSLNCRGADISLPRNGCSSRVAEGDRPEPLAHAPVGHHAAGELRGLVQVVLGPGAEFVEDQLLGRPPAQEEHQAGVQFALADVDAVFLGQELRGAQRPAAGNDRNLVQVVACWARARPAGRGPTRGRRSSTSPCR